MTVNRRNSPRLTLHEGLQTFNLGSLNPGHGSRVFVCGAATFPELRPHFPPWDAVQSAGSQSNEKQESIEVDRFTAVMDPPLRRILQQPYSASGEKPGAIGSTYKR